MDYFQSSARWLLDLIFPPRCLGCRRFTQREYICKQCFRSVALRRRQECIGCKLPTTLGITCTLCRRHSGIDQLIVAGSYQDRLLVAAIQAWKYRFIPELVHPMHTLLRKQVAFLVHHRKFSLLAGNPLIVPVPLSKRRERWRGFNQSLVLAHYIAATFQLQLAPLLTRTKHSQPQTTMEDRQERLKNVAGLFTCINTLPMEGRDILLIDDVCTTGATLDACAHELKQNGARSVTALVVARG